MREDQDELKPTLTLLQFTFSQLRERNRLDRQFNMCGTMYTDFLNILHTVTYLGMFPDFLFLFSNILVIFGETFTLPDVVYD